MSDPLATVVVMLAESDRAVLDLAARTYRHEGAREQAVHDELGMTATRFYQRVNVLLDNPDAYVAEPVLIKRLRRVRQARQADRSARRLEPR